MVKFFKTSLLYGLLIVLSSALPQWAAAQSRVVSGTVKDEKGTGLPGVTIIVKGTAGGTTSMADGQYSVKVSAGDELEFSFIGYASQTVRIGAQSVVDITLQEQSLLAEEVVVTAYAVQKKVNVTGSISQVKGTDLVATPVANISNALIGNTPGVSGLQTSGEPGHNAANIRIRGISTYGSASPLIVIDGVERLHGTTHTLLPDMIEVGSFIGMAAMTRSEVTIRDVSFENLGIIPAQFARMGIRFEQRGDDIYIPRHDHYEIESFIDGSIMNIADAPWPGLTPDLLSVFLVVATQAKGSVLIHQKMFESRLFFVDKLIDMGAQIILCDPHRATVIGHDHKIRLRATTMSSPDIRAGVALLIAAMSADGRSVIQNVEQIDRGYQNIDGRLNAIGADIRRID